MKKFFMIVLGVLLCSNTTICVNCSAPSSNVAPKYICEHKVLVSSTENNRKTYSINSKSIDSFVINEFCKYGGFKRNDISIYAKKALHNFNYSDYILYEFLPKGYAIFDLTSFDIVELSGFSTSPYIGYENSLFYVPLVGYFCKDDSNVYDIKTRTALNDCEIEELLNHSKALDIVAGQNLNLENIEKIRNSVLFETNIVSLKSGGGSGGSGEEHDADVELTNSWYFKKNTCEFASDHSFHSSGDCGYVALAMVLVYHELFSSKGYFSNVEANQYISNVYDNPNNHNSVPVVADELIGYLVNLYNTANQTPSALKKITTYFMSGKSIEYKHSTPLFYNKNTIKKQINNNNPVIICGKLNGACGNYGNVRIWHDAIIYGYYNSGNKYLTHYGWVNCSQIILADYALTYLYLLENENNHVHNNYYIYNNHRYCACGTLVS